jgi:hypothetical protein
MRAHVDMRSRYGCLTWLRIATVDSRDAVIDSRPSSAYPRNSGPQFSAWGCRCGGPGIRCHGGYFAVAATAATTRA